MLRFAIIDLFLQLGGDDFEIAIFGAAVLEVSDEGDEECLVEDAILLVLLDVESSGGVAWLSGSVVSGLSLVGLLEHYDGLEFLV